jgi:hypothetical protein
MNSPDARATEDPSWVLWVNLLPLLGFAALAMSRVDSSSEIVRWCIAWWHPLLFGTSAFALTVQLVRWVRRRGTRE